MKFLAFIEKQRKSVQIFLGIVSIGVIGLCDLWTGYEIAFSLFYVLPISFMAWFTGQSLGFVASLLSAVVWLWADTTSGHPYNSLGIPIWNTLILLAFFMMVDMLLSALRQAVERETALARTDNLTGTINSRYFHTLAQEELDRFQRYGHAFSLVYLDLDNFKTVNDRWGHAVGDEALRVVVQFIQTHIRRTDILARLGGDEFALLLPETNAAMVRVVCTKIQAGLLAEMERKQWPVTFSIGVLTCQGIPQNVDELLKRADELMYTVKHGAKNGIQYASYVG